jgi:hypothetical protein
MCGDTSASSTPVFCIVEFVQGTRVEKERAFMPGLPVVQNGPPGTFVTFADGRRVPLPTDQIVFAEDNGGAARVGFGGMRFAACGLRVRTGDRTFSARQGCGRPRIDNEAGSCGYASG